ncbi:MAG: hypothetical protein ACTSUR_08300 [Candidatus Heimdallarchaeaceae archaeon]
MDEFAKAALEAFEKGKKDSYIPQDPFISFGFDSNPFLSTSFDELRKESFLQSRIRKISHYIGKVYSSCEKISKNRKIGDEPPFLDGVLYGSSQSGLSTLIDFTCYLLSKQYDIVRVDAKEFVVYYNNQYSIAGTIQNFRNRLGDLEISPRKPSIVVVDHSDFLIEFFEDFREAFERDFQDLALIFVFTHSGWTRLKSYLAFSNYDLHNRIIQSIMIEPYTEREIEKILEIKLSRNGQILKPFTSQNIKLIAKTCGRSLKNAINMCVKICEECFYNAKDVASYSLVRDMGAILDIDIDCEFYNLITLRDNTQTFILALISMKSIAYDLGLTYDDVTSNIDIQKTSAAHHLKALEEKKFVHKTTINRIAHYRLKDSLQTIADTYLLPSFEQKETYVRLERILSTY